MPELSRFYGIVITMFYGEHAPPHFHAFYGDYFATFAIESGVMEGVFPARQRKLVLEWARLHRVELMEDWKKARAHKPLRRIAPLK